MKIARIRLFVFVVIAAAIITSGCDDNFYLSEKEVAAYNQALATESSMNLLFDNLQGRSITLVFDNSTGTPRLQSTNLLTEMRRTELAALETGQAAVDLERLSAELETQISTWVEGELQLFINSNTGDGVRLTRVDSVTVEFLNNPTFTFVPGRQAIAYDMRIRLAINATIEVTAVNWLFDLFAGINGTYPMQVNLPDLQLRGDASLYSPMSNAGRIRFGMVPVFNAPAQVLEVGQSIPNVVKNGVRDVFTVNLSARIDENFEQEYFYFAMPQIHLTSENPSRLKVYYRMKEWLNPDLGRPQLHMVTRAADGKLYHYRKSNGGWSTPTAVPFPSPGPTPYPLIFGEPSLVHSGQNQLELAATDTGGNVVYAHYRDDQWEAQRVIRPNTAYNPAISYQGNPAVIASAPGQAEIIVRGGDGNLWHHRRLNGAWLNPIQVPLSGNPNITAPFRDPVAVIAGNKIVLVFADSLNRLAVTGFDLETGLWGQLSRFTTSTSAPVSIVYAPAIVASGERRFSATVAASQIDVAYVKSGGSVFHQALTVNALNITSVGSSPGISFINQEKHVSSVVANATPVLTCSTYLQPELFVRSIVDNKIRHTHWVHALAPFTVDGDVVNPGWQGWTLVADNFVADSPKTDGRVQQFSAAGTNTGKTELAAFGLDATKQFFMHNEFESSRYAIAGTPWKTVHWRGWEAVGSQTPYGRPAIAAVDQNFQIAHMSTRPGFGPTVHFEKVAETNATYFMGLTTALRTVNPVPPIVLSSSPGVIDMIAIRNDGKPSHFRRTSDGGGYELTVTAPVGVTLLSTSASAYGNGLIDLAARGSDDRIYFWRYRGGVWTAPVAVATSVISAPALVYKGAGQLELLGIDLDYRLARWRLINNIWQPRLTIASSFTINPTYFRSSSVSSWGDGTVDVAVVGRDTTRLYHRRIGPGDEICTAPFGCPPPRAFANLGGSLVSSPVMTAFSPTRLNILVGQGVSSYSISANKYTPPFTPIPPPIDPPIAWTAFQSIGGTDMPVGGAAHTGRGNFAAIAVKEGKFYINRNISGVWTGFQPIVGGGITQALLTPVVRPAIVAYGD